MDKIILFALCAMTLVGCGDKVAEENARKAAAYDAIQHTASLQQKLEACMQNADATFDRERESEWARLGCRQYGDSPPADIVAACLQVSDLAKQSRREAEDRCVKLYK